jgi:hypothetical protein
MTAPNLDALTQEELRAFWLRYRRATTKAAAVLLGEHSHRARNAVHTLAAYAMAKSCAMGLRLEGKIANATVYEQHCELYYAELPEDFRW